MRTLKLRGLARSLETQVPLTPPGSPGPALFHGEHLGQVSSKHLTAQMSARVVCVEQFLQPLRPLFLISS